LVDSSPSSSENPKNIVADINSCVNLAIFDFFPQASLP
jgi:hypothetical protein